MCIVTALPHGRVWTRADRDELPDDGHRHELLDGLLIVTPSPSREHQRLSVRLTRRLADEAPAGMEVLVAPLDVDLSADTVVQPDLLVVPTDQQDTAAPLKPLLVIEILSPSTQLYDLYLKKSRYEKAGIEDYWVIDPLTGRLHAWHFERGAYVLIAEIPADEEFAAAAPFAVTLRPADRLGTL